MAQLTVFDIIKRPHMTPKAAQLNRSKLSQLVIIVHKNARKPEIRSAVSSIFGVEVLSVRTMIVKGKRKRSGGKHIFYDSDRKKAIITVKHKADISSNANSLSSDELVSGIQET